MHAMIALLTALHVLLHSLAGCCWHHAHSGEQAEAPSQVQQVCHRHAEHSHEAGHSSSHEQPPTEDCEGAKCVYTATKPAFSADSVDLLSVPAPVLAWLGEPAALAMVSRNHSDPSCAGPPSRLPQHPLILRI